MREIIDFNDFDKSGEDGVEAPLRKHGIRLDVSTMALIYLKTGVEDFSPEDKEPSVFDAIVDRAYSLKSAQEAWEFIESAVLRMVMVLGLPRTKTSETLCKAWVVDQLDEKVDINATDPYNDRWFDHVLHPRLSHLAQKNPKAFRKFQMAMGRFVNLPDLSSTNPTIYRKKAA